MRKGPAIFRAVSRFPLKNHGYLNSLIWGGGLLLGFGLLIHWHRGIGFLGQATVGVGVSLAITLSLGALFRAMGRYEEVLRESIRRVDLPESRKNELVNQQLQRVYDDKQWVKWFVPWAILIAILHELLRQGRADFFPQLQDLFRQFAFYVYSFLVMQLGAFILAGSLFVFVSHIRFLARISRCTPRVEPLEKLPYLDLSKVSRFSQFASFIWFVAVGFLGASFIESLTPIPIAFLLVLVAIGVMVFLIPELYLHFLIRSLKDRGIKGALAKAEGALASKDTTSANLWLQVASMIRSMRDWAFPASIAAQVTLSAFIPFGLTLLFNL